MIRNSSAPFLRLPPEIRLLIYTLILGNQSIWIGHTRELRKWNFVKTAHHHERGLGSTKEKFHLSGTFYHVTGRECSDPALDLRLLRTCRQIYSETALLPYSLNRFTFEDETIRKRFERSARAGKKRAQKKAVGKYEVGKLSDLYDDDDDGRTKWHPEGLRKWHQLLTMPWRRVIGPDFHVRGGWTWTCDGWHTPDL